MKQQSERKRSASIFFGNELKSFERKLYNFCGREYFCGFYSRHVLKITNFHDFLLSIGIDSILSHRLPLNRYRLSCGQTLKGINLYYSFSGINIKQQTNSIRYLVSSKNSTLTYRYDSSKSYFLIESQ